MDLIHNDVAKINGHYSKGTCVKFVWVIIRISFCTIIFQGRKKIPNSNFQYGHKITDSIILKIIQNSCLCSIIVMPCVHVCKLEFNIFFFAEILSIKFFLLMVVHINFRQVAYYILLCHCG